MSKPAFFITTPIYYPSANLHIGHAYCSTIADTIARYKRANGFDVRFVTGSDEHGLKIQRKAEENGMTPLQYVDGIVANFKKLWEMLGISYTDFVRSSSAEHERVVQEILQRVYDKGDIYKRNMSGNTAFLANPSGRTVRLRKQAAFARTVAVLWKRWKKRTISSVCPNMLTKFSNILKIILISSSPFPAATK